MNTKAITAESLKRKNTLKKKRTRNRLIILTVIAVLGGGIWYLFVPFKGGITYGVCKTFLQLYVRYPQYMRLSSMDDFGDSVRIWFTQVDDFGEYRLEPIQCYYRYPEEEEKMKYGNVKFIIDRVTISRREIDPDIIERFNTSMSVVIANPPDLTLPSPIPDSLEDMQIQPELFRKPIF